MSDSLPTHLRNAAVAALASVPVAGGPLSVLLDKYLPNYIEKRRQEFLDRLATSFHELADEVDPSNLHSDEFLAVFIRCAKLYVEEGSERKREALRSIVLNSALRHESQFDEITLFLRLISGLTEDQIRILAELDAAEDVSTKHQDLTNALKAQWPSVDDDYLMACVADLLNFNLIRSGWSSKKSTGSAHALTPLGSRFVSFITEPTRDADESGA